MNIIIKNNKNKNENENENNIQKKIFSNIYGIDKGIIELTLKDFIKKKKKIINK